MSYDYKLANEMYGSPWSVDLMSFNSLSSILKDIRSGVVMSLPETKLNSISLLECKSETRLIRSTWSLDNRDSFDGIGIINLNGPITKNGGASTYGTKQMSSQMLQMSKDSRIKGFMILGDSGGGATGAVRLMADTINEVKKIMPVYTLIEKGGVLGSAAYAIAAPSTGIYSEDGMNIVGSAGTMIQLKGKPHGNVDQDGEKTITLYASKSISKNKPFNEAINNDNYELIINELLDPINEDFLSEIVSDRPILKGTNFDDGHTVFSKDAIGTFIDGIASFDEVVSMILSDSKKGVNTNQNNNSNSNKMNKEELKQQHPAVYSEILQEGVSQEQERRAGWNAFKEIDSKAVEEGIASGLPIKQSEVNSFIVKATMVSKVNELQSDNAPAFTTNETSTEGDPVLSAHQKEIEAAFNF
jgi:ClpP class serine protease